VHELQNFNGKSYATAMQGESLYTQNLTQATAFVIGNEGAGLRSQTIAAATKCITIPMIENRHGAVESLNAGAAAAVCLFERMRQTLAI